MCKCTPNMKTPFCGKGDCQWPKQEGIRIEITRMCMWCGKQYNEELEKIHAEDCNYFKVFTARYIENKV